MVASLNSLAKTLFWQEFSTINFIEDQHHEIDIYGHTEPWAILVQETVSIVLGEKCSNQSKNRKQN